MNERMDILRKYNLWTRGDLYFHRRSAAHRRMGKVGQFLFAGLYRGVRALYQRLQLTDAVRLACHAAFGAIRPISGISLQLSGVYRDKASGTEPRELYEYGRNPGTFCLARKAGGVAQLLVCLEGHHLAEGHQPTLQHTWPPTAWRPFCVSCRQCL